MPLRIRPTVDFAFKLLFGSPEHVRVTIHFLNAVLKPRVRITGITIQNPFLGKGTEEDKLSILDILAVDEQGRFPSRGSPSRRWANIGFTRLTVARVRRFTTAEI